MPTGRGGSKRRHARPQAEEGNAAAVAGAKPDAAFAAQCEAFRRFYATVDRAEWWWIMDDSLEAIGKQLQREDYCVLDGFLAPAQAKELKGEVEQAHHIGRLEAAGLVNGRVDSKEDSKYLDTAIRGDLIGWFDSDKEGWPHGRMLEAYLLKLGTLISELKQHVPELQRVTGRSKAMVACYPGGGARYIKHVDNDGKHPLCRTRLLTGLMYLNDAWRPGDGGELAVFRGDDKTVMRQVVEPLSNRLVLFWSDWRVPHEVLAAQMPRYAVTLWFLDNTKKADESVSPEAPIGQSSGERAQPASEAGDAEPRESKGSAGGAGGGEAVAGAAAVDHEPEAQSARYKWHRLGERDDGPWELSVELLQESAGCPALDLSDVQVRVASEDGEALVCLPLPFRPGQPASKWSRKKRTLTVRFEPASSQMPSAAEAAQVSAEALAGKLRACGWGALDGFLPAAEADELRDFVLAKRAAGRLRVGRNAHEGEASSGRGKNDEYAFLEQAELEEPGAAALKRCQRRLNELIVRLMRDQALPGLGGVQMTQGRPMVAVYPGGGARYERHYDSMSSTRGDNGRVMTFIVYLNPFWRESHGGSLRILESLKDDAGPEVEPLHGRLVGFLCKDRCPHEVLPCWADRVAVTIWYYDGERLAERCQSSEADIQGFGFEAGD